VKLILQQFCETVCWGHFTVYSRIMLWLQPSGC